MHINWVVTTAPNDDIHDGDHLFLGPEAEGTVTSDPTDAYIHFGHASAREAARAANAKRRDADAPRWTPRRW